MIRVDRLGRPPDALDALRREALAEGYAFVERLAAEWAAAPRALGGAWAGFAARIGDRLAGVAALTSDPHDPAPDLMRVRHVYVRPGSRRVGVGRALARALLNESGAPAGRLQLRACDARAARFWGSVGFTPVQDEARPHLAHRAALAASLKA